MSANYGACYADCVKQPMNDTDFCEKRCKKIDGMKMKSSLFLGGKRRRRRSRRKSRRKSRKSRRKRRKSRRKKKSRNKRGGKDGCREGEWFNISTMKCAPEGEWEGGRRRKKSRRKRKKSRR